MPEISGFEVLDRLQHDSTMQTIPVIIHSSTQLDSETQSRLAKQCVAILSKETTSQDSFSAQLRSALIRSGLVLDTAGESHG